VRPVPGEALALPGGDELLARLRAGEPAIVGYLADGRLILDLRTVAEEDDEPLLAAVRAARDEDSHFSDHGFTERARQAAEREAGG